MTHSGGSPDRREFFRVKTAPNDPVRVSFRLSDNPQQVFLARVDSISVGGVGIVLNLIDSPSVPAGVGSGKLILPGLGRVQFEGVLEWSSGARVGVRFVQINEMDKSLIFRYVVQRERELARTARKP